MKTTLAILSIVLFGYSVSLESIQAQDTYKLGPDSHEQKDVPKGEINGPMKWMSKVFPGTEFDIKYF
jgi:hypothetical protein